MTRAACALVLSTVALEGDAGRGGGCGGRTELVLVGGLGPRGGPGAGGGTGGPPSPGFTPSDWICVRMMFCRLVATAGGREGYSLYTYLYLYLALSLSLYLSH